MVRKPASPFIRTTEVGGFVNAGWKEYWYKSLEKSTQDLLLQEILAYSKGTETPEFWKAIIARYSPLREAARIGRESTDFGKAVHSLAEAHLLGKPLPTTIALEDEWKKSYTRAITERESTCGGYLIKWCKEAGVKPLIISGQPAIELPLEDESLGITGHPDLVCTFGNDPTPWLADWKTSKECRDEYGLQLGAYALAIKSQYGITVNDGVIVRVPSDPNAEPQFETHVFRDLITYHGEVFKSALDTVQYFKHKGRHKKLKVKEAA